MSGVDEFRAKADITIGAIVKLIIKLALLAVVGIAVFWVIIVIFVGTMIVGGASIGAKNEAASKSKLDDAYAYCERLGVKVPRGVDPTTSLDCVAADHRARGIKSWLNP